MITRRLIIRQLNIHMTDYCTKVILFGWLLFLLFVEDQQGRKKGFNNILIYYKIGLLMNR